MVEVRRLNASEAVEFAGYTFPAYRHLLNLERFTNVLDDPTQPDYKIARKPFAFGAFDGLRPVGLLLGSFPEETSEKRDMQRNADVLSVFAGRDFRRQGVARMLFEEAEAFLRDNEQPVVFGTYMTGKPSIAHLEELLLALGCEPPEFRFATARFRQDRILEAPWLRKLPRVRNYETVPWSDIEEAEKLAAREKNAQEKWIPDALCFWLFTPEMACKHTSLGIRYKGEFVGWVINHPFRDTPTVRFATAFIRWDLARLGLALPAVAKSIQLMPTGGYTHGSFMTPPHLEGMQAAIAKYVTPWADSVAESRGVWKRLTN